MTKLILYTRYPATVQKIMSREQLIDMPPPWNIEVTIGSMMKITLNYPDDVLSQSITYWLALAKGCDLISNYEIGGTSYG